MNSNVRSQQGSLVMRGYLEGNKIDFFRWYSKDKIEDDRIQKGSSPFILSQLLTSAAMATRSSTDPFAIPAITAGTNLVASMSLTFTTCIVLNYIQGLLTFLINNDKIKKLAQIIILYYQKIIQNYLKVIYVIFISVKSIIIYLYKYNIIQYLYFLKDFYN